MRINRKIRTLLFAVAVLTMSVAASAQIGISVNFGPPALPVYEQPICPGDGYLWTPGYWAWDGSDYYWVPGTWILAPEVGFLWTPPWWGWSGGAFLFHEGFWGPHIGFYGGINYGFGYFGTGFVGGRWDGGHFFYNRSVANINVVNIHNVYNETINIHSESHVSFNGGQGGIEARASADEEAAMRDRHVGPIASQMQHVEAARGNPELRASSNHGRPPIAATGRAGDFKESAVPAREAGGEYHAPENHGGPAAGGQPRPAVHPNELPAMEHPAAPNTGNPKLDQKYQQQQQKLMDKQNNERQKLQQQQEKDHQQLQRQKAPPERQQQVEQQHQQQTQQLQQRHQSQMQTLQSHQSRPSGGKPR
jgi:hypothetical protein